MSYKQNRYIVKKMEERIHFIQIVLENVETINIDINDIEFMHINGICEQDFIYRTAEKKIQKNKWCSSINICINKRADKYYDTGWYDDLTVFQRIQKWSDIVSISYLDESKNEVETIYVPWLDEKCDCDNHYQSSKIDKDGNLEIIIKGEHEC